MVSDPRLGFCSVVATLCLVLGLLSPGIASAQTTSAAQAQQTPYFHCSAALQRGGWDVAQQSMIPWVWAHVQSDNVNIASNNCITINRLSGGPPTSCTAPSTGAIRSCYVPVMLSYSIEQIVTGQKAADQTPACWGVNDADGSMLVIAVSGAPVQYAESWCQGLQWF